MKLGKSVLACDQLKTKRQQVASTDTLSLMAMKTSQESAVHRISASSNHEARHTLQCSQSSSILIRLQISVYGGTLETKFQRMFFYQFSVDDSKSKKKAFHVADLRSLTSKESLKGEELLPTSTSDVVW